MADTYISRTISSTSTPKKLTCSFWIKRTGTGNSTQRIFSQSNDGSFDMYWRWESGDIFVAWNELNAGGTLNSITPNMRFRDFNAWYHIVLRWDTTQSTSTDRIRMYVNGTNISSLGGYSAYTAPSLNDTIGFFSSTSCKFDIGYYRANGGENLDSILSHVHVCDGYSYAPTEFGQTDSTTGEWKIKAAPSVSYGTNGFWIFKDGTNLSGSTVQDQSGQNNHFTVGNGTLTKTEDNPSNVFATFNPNANNANASLFNGNTTVYHSSTSWKRALLNMGHTQGKWYWEVKRTSSATPYIKTGMVEEDGQWKSMPSHEHHADNTYGWAWYVNGGNIELRTGQAVISGYSQSDLGNTNIGVNDIICVALDLDNGRLHARKNDGSWLKSGDPAAGSGGYSIANFTANTKMYIPATSVYGTTTARHNFGNGYFGTSAVSSAGTNASGFGIFEYDVPTGFTAWSTKGFNV
jgi:hypothetical protein